MGGLDFSGFNALTDSSKQDPAEVKAAKAGNTQHLDFNLLGASASSVSKTHKEMDAEEQLAELEEHKRPDNAFIRDMETLERARLVYLLYQERIKETEDLQTEVLRKLAKHTDLKEIVILQAQIIEAMTGNRMHTITVTDRMKEYE